MKFSPSFPSKNEVSNINIILALCSNARMMVKEDVLCLGVLDGTWTCCLMRVFAEAPFAKSLLQELEKMWSGIPVFVLATNEFLNCQTSCNHFHTYKTSWYSHRMEIDCISGVHLDVNLYFAIWDKTLVPDLMYVPMNYNVSNVSDESEVSDVTSDAISDFFLNYMKNDNLGMICNIHIAYADMSPDEACCEQCIKLAGFASIAVDFNKTGVSQ
jgi:hypothetical protein